METRKNIFITVYGEIDSQELYEKVRNYHMNVTNLGTRVYVYGTVNLTEPLVEYILQICYSYGNCDVKLASISK